MSVMQKDRKLLAQGFILFAAMPDSHCFFEQKMLGVGRKLAPKTDDGGTQNPQKLVVALCVHWLALP
jgi:hypothetical protein